MKTKSLAPFISGECAKPSYQHEGVTLKVSLPSEGFRSQCPAGSLLKLLQVTLSDHAETRTGDSMSLDRAPFNRGIEKEIELRSN